MPYLVMECHPAYAVVLSDDGRFLKAANMGYQVGQSLERIIEMSVPESEPVRKKRAGWVGALGTMAACLVLVLGGYVLNFMPYASVYMSINPQVRIDVSRTDRVVDVTGVNADGEKLVQEYDSSRKELDLVMDELVDRAIDMGYLHEGGKITLTLDASEKWVSGHQENLNSHLSDHLNNKLSVTIDITTPEAQAAQPTQATSTGETLVIPLAPQADYGEADYGSQEDGDSGYGEPNDSGYDKDQDSGYDDREDGQTDYDAQDADSSYDKADPASDYEAPDPDSGYEAPEADSGYEAPDPDSGYDAPDSGYDGGSDYEKGSDYDD